MFNHWQAQAALALVNVSVLALLWQIVPVGSLGEWLRVIGTASGVIGFVLTTSTAVVVWRNT